MPERHRILIVDDDAQDRQAVAEALRREAARLDGVETDILEADTIGRAREALRREEFACVFLDHSLPDGTSLDLLMELRAQGRDTPVVVLTGQRDEQAVAEVMRAGAADYLPKERLHPDLVARSLRASLRFLQAQREKQAALDDLRARDRAIAAASNGIAIADPRRTDAPLVYVNGSFLNMTGYAEEEVIGRNCRFLQGPDTDPAAVTELREAVRQERPCQVLILNYRKDGSTFWNEVTVSPVRDARGTLTHFVGIQTDVTARQLADAERGRAEAALRRRAARERFLADFTERARRLSDPDAVISDAVRSVGEFLGVSRCVFADIDIEADVCTIPVNYRADDSVASMTGAFPISAFGPFLITEYQAGRTVTVDDVCAEPVRVPPAYLGAYEAVGVRAFVSAPVLHSARLVSVIAVHSSVPRHWEAEEVELLQAVVERTWLTVEILRQQRALAREAVALRRSEARYRAVFEALTEGVTVQDVTGVFQEANSGAERILGLSRDQMVGRTSADPRWRTVHEDGSPLPGEEHPPMVALRTGRTVRDMLMGIHRPDGTLAWLSANAEPILDPATGEPTGVVTSFFDITAQREAQQYLKARAEREALVNRISQALRAFTEPEVIQEKAASLLGTALGADRCFYVVYDSARDQAQVSQDWRRVDLPSIAGGYRASEFRTLLGELFPTRQTAVVEDVRASFSPAVASAFDAARHRAVLAVPFFDAEQLVAALYVSVADAPRAWTEEEAVLVEQVASLTRTSLEAALVQQREHRIAEQLQDALQPSLPENIPSLTVGKFTRPALDEAQIGGDFYDIFALDKELYAVVMGDVSGKGLAAAQQLALIRNSLRTTLYLYRSPAQAASALNRIVTSHDLLVGFVTAWVGIYDALTGKVAYCSCGHEPGLVMRSGGAVEETATTGPPLGVAENAEYAEETVALTPGDALLLYTDGLSEAGPSRRELLGTGGLARLLAALPGDLDVQAEAEALVARVGEAAGGAFRDDVAVLLMRRE